MEERIIDKDELRGVKKKRTGGEEDVVDINDDAQDEADEASPDYAIEFEGEYDEDLVGLTPTQLREELERRERLREEAHAEAVKYLASAEEKFAAGNFRGAEKDFAEARLYEDSEETEERYFAAVTQNYTDVARLLERDKAAEFAYAGERARQSVLSVFGEALRSERAEAEERAQPLRERVHADMEARRAPFAANKKYYAVRFLIALATLVVFAVGIAVSASFLLRTQSIAPTVLTIAFGACTFIAFLVTLFFTRKLYVAARLCRENEKLSSTEEGAELQTLEDRLAVLADVLDGAGESED